MKETILVAYASATNQSPENKLKARIKVTLTRTGILDCQGKPLLQELEQITLSDNKIDHLEKCFTILDYFHLYKSRLQKCRQWIQLFNLNLEGLHPQIGERSQNHFLEQQLLAELKELVKTDNVDEEHFVQATRRFLVHFALKIKPYCNHDKFRNYEFFFIERRILSRSLPKYERHIY